MLVQGDQTENSVIRTLIEISVDFIRRYLAKFIVENGGWLYKGRHSTNSILTLLGRYNSVQTAY